MSACLIYIGPEWAEEWFGDLARVYGECDDPEFYDYYCGAVGSYLFHRTRVEAAGEVFDRHHRVFWDVLYGFGLDYIDTDLLDPHWNALYGLVGALLSDRYRVGSLHSVNLLYDGTRAPVLLVQ